MTRWSPTLLTILAILASVVAAYSRPEPCRVGQGGIEETGLCGGPRGSEARP